jgi:hypothetical protein
LPFIQRLSIGGRLFYAWLIDQIDLHPAFAAAANMLYCRAAWGSNHLDSQNIPACAIDARVVGANVGIFFACRARAGAVASIIRFCAGR